MCAGRGYLPVFTIVIFLTMHLLFPFLPHSPSCALHALYTIVYTVYLFNKVVIYLVIQYLSNLRPLVSSYGYKKNKTKKNKQQHRIKSLK